MEDIIWIDLLKQSILNEHDSSQIGTKRVLVYGWDLDNLLKVRLKVDADGRLIISQESSSIGCGNIAVATTATRLIAASTPCKRVIVHAAEGHIVVGDSSVVYAEATRKGVWIPKGNSMPFFVNNVNLLYARSGSGTPLATFTYEN